jgi:hypothetical protein
MLPPKADLAKSGQECRDGPTLKLPPEILGAIFRQIDRNSMELVRITAVCTRWRAIAIHTPYLWTSIKVHVNDLSKRRTRVILSRIDLFLSRAGDLPLDVEWHAYGNKDSVPHFYNLFRKKGPFTRWKTLSLHLNADVTNPFGEFQENDRFSSLALLALVSQPPPLFLDCLNKTVSKNLITLELGGHFQRSDNFHTEYAGILRAITILHTWNAVVLPAVPFPPNVTVLKANTLPGITMPYVRHIHVNTLGLAQFIAFNPANVVVLDVHVGIDGSPSDSSINLPSLLWLTLRENSFSALSALKAPSLHALVIDCPRLEAQTIDGPFITALRNGFQAFKLVILVLSIRLDGPTTLEVLRMFPGISYFSLHCYDATHAEMILWHVFPVDRKNFNICPSINVISVVLDVPPSSEKEWGGYVWATALDIGDSLCSLESRWPEGSCWRLVGETRKVLSDFYPSLLKSDPSW